MTLRPWFSSDVVRLSYTLLVVACGSTTPSRAERTRPGEETGRGSTDDGVATSPDPPSVDGDPKRAPWSPEPTNGPSELPRAWVETTMPAASGAVRIVPAGGDFQAALDAAAPGDVIELAAGASFIGPFSLPAKTGDAWIVVRSSSWAELPPAGTRVSPADAPKMAKLLGPTDWSYGPAIRALARSHHFRFVGVEFGPTSDDHTPFDLVALGYTEETLEEVPHHLVLDRAYVHGSPTKGGKRGVLLHAAHAAVVDSYLTDFKMEGFDTQAIGGWNTPGPVKIVGNYIAGAAENICLGGALPTIRGLVPADIEVRDNVITKPLAWKTEGWSEKNLLELKSGERVLIEGNLFEHSWPDAQVGYAFMFTPRSDSGSWAKVADITIRHNVIRDAAGGAAISGRDPDPTTGTYPEGGRYVIDNNLWQAIDGHWLLIVNSAADVVVRRNSVEHTGNVLMTDALSLPNPRLVLEGNLAPHNAYGLCCGQGGKGLLDASFPGWVMRSNVIYGPEAVEFAARMPPDNSYVMAAPDPRPEGVGIDLSKLKARNRYVP